MFCQEAGYTGTINVYKVDCVRTDITIVIRRCIIQIPIEGPGIRAIIPIATE
jgi:hypothetical protein